MDECKLAVVVGVSAEQSSEGEDKQKFSKKLNDFYSIFALKKTTGALKSNSGLKKKSSYLHRKLVLLCLELTTHN